MRVLASKWLLLGESPNVATVGRPRLWLLPDGSGIKHSANRLLEYTGYDRETYLGTFKRDNLIHRLPRRKQRGRNFPVESARREAKRIYDEHEACYGVVMLGQRVPRAFEWWTTGDAYERVPLSHLELLRWYWIQHCDGRRMPAVIVPHPSGLCRWWNSAENRARALHFFQTLQDGPVIEEVRRPRLRSIATNERATKAAP